MPGLKPHSVSEKYYFARGPQQVNRVVDISNVMPQKSGDRFLRNDDRAHGERSAGRPVRKRAAGCRAKWCAANQEFIQAAFVERDSKVGSKYGMQYAEEFHYIGPDKSLDEYLQRNAKPV